MHSMQPILISRFLINLRQADRPDNMTEISRFSKFSIPNFHVPTTASIVGDMGEPLEHGLSDIEDDRTEQEAGLTSASGKGDDSEIMQVESDGNIQGVSYLFRFDHFIEVDEAETPFTGPP